jgi:hypothetical protein
VLVLMANTTLVRVVPCTSVMVLLLASLARRLLATTRRVVLVFT